MSVTAGSATAGASTAGVDRDAVYRKIAWRLLPFILICLIVNYLDRVSIGYAKLQFQSDLHVNEARFGLITAVFFLGYIACEVPSNMLAARYGAPSQLTRIMLLWGAVMVSMTFARDAWWLADLESAVHGLHEGSGGGPAAAGDHMGAAHAKAHQRVRGGGVGSWPR